MRTQVFIGLLKAAVAAVVVISVAVAMVSANQWAVASGKMPWGRFDAVTTRADLSLHVRVTQPPAPTTSRRLSVSAEAPTLMKRHGSTDYLYRSGIGAYGLQAVRLAPMLSEHLASSTNRTVIAPAFSPARARFSLRVDQQG